MEATTKDAVVKMVKSQVCVRAYVCLCVCTCPYLVMPQVVVDSIAGAVVAALQPVLHSTLDNTFTSTSQNMVDAFERSCQDMCVQINQAFNTGTSQCELGHPNGGRRGKGRDRGGRDREGEGSLRCVVVPACKAS